MPTLNTRIKLKYDTLTSWSTANPVLLNGEVAVVAIPTSEPNTVGQVTKPAIVFKVGDNSTAFNDLPYASGLAADVYAWAKQQQLPITVSGDATGVITNVYWNASANGLDFVREDLSGTYDASAGNYVSGIIQSSDGSINITQKALPPSVPIPTYTLSNVAGEGTVRITGGETDSTVTIAGFSDVAGLARNAVQTVANGTANGTILVDGEAVSVGGLGSAAYTDASDYATSAQGNRADSALQTVANTGSGVVGSLTVSGTAIQAVRRLITDSDITSNTITAGKLAPAVQTNLGLASTALQASAITTGATNGTIAVNGADVAVHGLGNAAYVNTDAFDASGTAAGIGAQINGTISGMNTRLGNAESDIDELTSRLDDIGTALYFAGAGANLPTGGSYSNGAVYIITSGEDAGKEYIYVDGEWEEFGDTSDYLLSSTAQSTYVAIANINNSTVSDALTSSTVTGITVSSNGAFTLSKQPIRITSDAVTDLGDLATADEVTQAQVNGLSNTLATINSNIGSSVTNAINALDGVISGAAGANMALNVFSQTDGVVTAEFVPIAIAISQVTDLQDELDSKLEAANLTGYVQGTGLTANAIVLGNAGSNVKASSFTISNGALNTSAANVVPSSNAVATYVTGRGYQTSSQVTNAIENALSEHDGIDAVGTVTSVTAVTANTGLVVTNGTSTPTIDIDANAVFILDCGTAETNID